MESRILVTLAVSFFLSPLSVADRKMLPTQDAFAKYQYTTKGEFVESLRKNPKSLYNLARVFGVGQRAMLEYIEGHLSLQKLSAARHCKVWCIKPNGRTYTVGRTYKAGEAVWATSNGTPVIRWVCTNPLLSKLPAVSPPMPVQIPETPVKTEVKEEVKEEVKVEIKEEVKEEVKVEVKEEVNVEVKEEVKVKEPVKVEVKEEVKAAVIEDAVRIRPWSAWLGAIEYDTRFRASGDRTHVPIAYGVSYDFYRTDRLRAGLYAEGAGHLQKDIALQFLGGGLQARYLLSTGQGWSPSLGAGLGSRNV